MLNEAGISKEFVESFYGVKVYCTYDSEPPTTISIDVIKSLNSDDHYLSRFWNGIKNISHAVTNTPYTVEYKHFLTMLSVISDLKTDPMTSDTGPLVYSWDFVARWRFLNNNSAGAPKFFKDNFPSCTKIKVEPPILLTSVDDPINDFAQAGIKLSGVLNHTTNNEGLPDV
ncbi:hypothetical protein H6P87_01246 [Rickettsia tillamookensis]|uniref:Uncharacterized protein n=1 Tax=Rickettsia tillamookensis TaxID=2761623 RepID=A0A9E6MJH0_9RICK|nr:hypothetical protein [Rickettsia tillamookensis]QQV75682.1 hypothetical protein H6P87_01246 [Rickettsia tillamookensis]